jgi:hypothetical protein
LTAFGLVATPTTSRLWVERLRAAFEATFKPFTRSMEIVLPRPEALPFAGDASRRAQIIQLCAHRKPHCLVPVAG